jgi:hypothetical protein
MVGEKERRPIPTISTLRKVADGLESGELVLDFDNSRISIFGRSVRIDLQISERTT